MTSLLLALVEVKPVPDGADEEEFCVECIKHETEIQALS